MHDTLPLLENTSFPAIARGRLTILQVNLGYLCNQQCLHCHVNASPKRKEIMDRQTAEQILDYLKHSSVTILDLTGGAPELNPQFRWLVESARKLGANVNDRCNLTILEEPGQEDLAQFLADHQVEITASLPCYLEENVDSQRGKSVFANSINALQKLNRLGYGLQDSSLKLNLVYNPVGPYLPPSQQPLEAEYKKQLYERYGIHFTRLYTIANMPIQRFGSTLVSKGEFTKYMTLLTDAHKDSNLDSVMCRSLISVDWQGYVYDCDFNQMLKLPLLFGGKPKIHITELMNQNLEGNPIVVMDHCYGCTAGQGSSCGGALL
ncbi:MAG: arsenosugar biosynthesis radical SAM protein ArsS [Gammaproteobacteria bacterium]|nr:arsenosugar biosynthesis radical SAM protein ArsS [Gammaproteobacteria bacterium]